ncbi:hypothetical protein [Hydrogenimonas sp. SS33]|uniref:hypothetical protein n=1 Tax=Hydrogenimonas leucolamina TaxID=2954236 RepID=UPI00336BCA5F
MPTRTLGYKEMLKTLVEYQITFIERLAHEGYDKTFSLLLFPWPGGDEERLRELLLPLLRRSDRLFYIEEKIVALLPGTDWNGAMKVRETLEELLGPRPEKECIVEYPADGSDAFELISRLYAQCDEIKAG